MNFIGLTRQWHEQDMNRSQTNKQTNKSFKLQATSFKNTQVAQHFSMQALRQHCECEVCQTFGEQSSHRDQTHDQSTFTTNQSQSPTTLPSSNTQSISFERVR